MTWPTTGTVPLDVNALRTMLGRCNSWTSNGGGVNQVHYPDFAEETATFPAALAIFKERLTELLNLEEEIEIGPIKIDDLQLERNDIASWVIADLDWLTEQPQE